MFTISPTYSSMFRCTIQLFVLVKYPKVGHFGSELLPHKHWFTKKGSQITETISKNHSNHLQKSLKISKNAFKFSSNDTPSLPRMHLHSASWFFDPAHRAGEGLASWNMGKSPWFQYVSMVKWFTRPGKRLQFANWKMAIYSWFIVDLPIKNCDFQ